VYIHSPKKKPLAAKIDIFFHMVFCCSLGVQYFDAVFILDAVYISVPCYCCYCLIRYSFRSSDTEEVHIAALQANLTISLITCDSFSDCVSAAFQTMSTHLLINPFNYIASTTSVPFSSDACRTGDILLGTCAKQCSKDPLVRQEQ
jgi:hypothetical protein